MTDEEKAEKYADKILSDSKYPFIFNKQKVKAYIIKVYLDSLKCCEEAYNKGLAEGRKKEADLIFESWCKGSDDEQCECGFLKKLEKENAELRKEKWHDLRKNPEDLPKCTENEQVIFYVQEYYKGIEKYINHYCLGFYKKSFMNDDVKLFVEKSKGYECEHSIEDVLRWCELPMFEEA